jgi:serine/threonine protein kinase
MVSTGPAHADLKSANILVNDMKVVKIADFGLSKIDVEVQALTGGLGTYQW